MPPASAVTEAPPLRVVETRKRRFSLHSDDLFDLTRTAVLHDLFALPPERRDDDWHRRFFDAAWHGSAELPAPTAFTGPDGFPYLRFDLPRGGAFEAQSIGNLARSLVDNATGAAIFASPDDPADAPQFVFSMGRLDAMLRFDDPAGDPVDADAGARPVDEAVYAVDQRNGHQALTVRASHQVMIGAPSSEYLPPATARALYRHLVQGWGIAEPRVAVMVDPALRPSRSLIVNRRRDGFGAGQDPDGAARMLLWYMMPTQTIMLLPDTITEQQLVPLSGYLGEGAPAND
ncbi:hypothetical protein [Sphingomonas guangdongensis]|uniref:hypothetical protein n=1 Tax=Sphingomonas guangdongensis TaxID=1141890 RepID=UPI000BE2D332|nr:hypothetical protein [Sphingomonas guangdongensis]